tara:strand:- start:31422 stop:31973 length:552 start_codon:yes stop_codon:yes gene_type:complete
MTSKTIANLSDKFNPLDIEWRMQRAGWKDGKPWAMVLCYINNRAIMDRLDEVCTPFNWANEFRIDSDGAITCGISIRNPSTKEWVTKYDSAGSTDIEAVKGGRSSAMKRAGVQWGIGRYLYNMENSFAETRLDYPPQQEKALWNKHYDKSEKKAFFWKNPNLPKWALPQPEPAGPDVGDGQEP